MASEKAPSLGELKAIEGGRDAQRTAEAAKRTTRFTPSPQETADLIRRMLTPRTPLKPS
jgi:hypothetical protein